MSCLLVLYDAIASPPIHTAAPYSCEAQRAYYSAAIVAGSVKQDGTSPSKVYSVCACVGISPLAVVSHGHAELGLSLTCSAL